MMLGRLTTLTLLISLSAAAPRQISVIVVEVGGTVDFPCPVSEKEGRFFHWYKQSPGYLFETVATGTFTKQMLQGPFQNPRFKVTEGDSNYILSITDVVKEDEGTYFCQNGTAYSQTFVYGNFLAVNDQSQQSNVFVKQSPETASVHPGFTVTLQCSLLSQNIGNRVECPDDQMVYWFRAASQHSHPGIVYTNRSTEKRSCVYSLTKTIEDSTDAGTYYCAVAICGEILFGEGTEVETRHEWHLVAAVLGALLALCLIVIAVLVFSRH
uniref:uncharacterized protein LOC122778727 n=1 Tax=Solea senegalensis TaxID=28829 RepID=UPI001CD8341A|nr:uncharacterized protein LOC122778727 [Solea senegalensis]